MKCRLYLSIFLPAAFLALDSWCANFNDSQLNPYHPPSTIVALSPIEEASLLCSRARHLLGVASAIPGAIEAQELRCYENIFKLVIDINSQLFIEPPIAVILILQNLGCIAAFTAPAYATTLLFCNLLSKVCCRYPNDSGGCKEL